MDEQTGKSDEGKEEKGGGRGRGRRRGRSKENASQLQRSWNLEIENSQKTRRYRRVPLSSRRAPVS